MILGIDASNIRAGGGVTHLQNLLQFAVPEKVGIKKVIVWGGKNTLDQLVIEKSKPFNFITISFMQA